MGPCQRLFWAESSVYSGCCALRSMDFTAMNGERFGTGMDFPASLAPSGSGGINKMEGTII